VAGVPSVADALAAGEADAGVDSGGSSPSSLQATATAMIAAATTPTRPYRTALGRIRDGVLMAS